MFTDSSFKSNKQFWTLVLVYGNDVKKMRSHQLKHWMWRRKTSIGRNADSLHEKVSVSFKRRDILDFFLIVIFVLFFTKLKIHKINKTKITINIFFCLWTIILLFMSRFMFTLFLLPLGYSNTLQILNIDLWLYNI